MEFQTEVAGPPGFPRAVEIPGPWEGEVEVAEPTGFRVAAVTLKGRLRIAGLGVQGWPGTTNKLRGSTGGTSSRENRGPDGSSRYPASRRRIDGGERLEQS